LALVAPLLPLPLLVGGCFFPFPYSRPPLELPLTPKPLEALNTPYNDYNAAAPDVAGGELVFATDRASAGAQYDLFETTIHFAEDDVDAKPPVPLAGPINSPANELGPFIEYEYFERIIVFASDRPTGAGGLDLYSWREGQAPRALAGLNTRYDEAYWTAWDEAGMRGRPALFATNRDGQGFDAYQMTDWPEGPADVARVEALSTPYDETAFFAFNGRAGLGEGAYVLFASNRPGGLGDFDLYCSESTSSGFSAPVPLRYANSPAKEFRPIIIRGEFNSVLVFSSNRPGGKGGMDLYYAAFENPCSPRAASPHGATR
jgi:hypothetical protein